MEAQSNESENLVTLESVQRALIALESVNLSPTYMNIRSELGGGSMREIGRFRQEALAARRFADAASKKLPADLDERFKLLAESIWQEAQRQANVALEGARKEYAARLSEESAALEEAFSQNERLEAELKSTRESSSALSVELTAFKEHNAELRGQLRNAQEHALQLNNTILELGARQQATRAPKRASARKGGTRNKETPEVS